jgi:hypothetical protein
MYNIRYTVSKSKKLAMHVRYMHLDVSARKKNKAELRREGRAEKRYWCWGV